MRSMVERWKSVCFDRSAVAWPAMQSGPVARKKLRRHAMAALFATVVASMPWVSAPASAQQICETGVTAVAGEEISNPENLVRDVSINICAEDGRGPNLIAIGVASDNWSSNENHLEITGSIVANAKEGGASR